MIRKKDIKTLFSSIRKHNNSVVDILLDAYPELVKVCASAPPKKDDGQSPLQVAFKTGNFEIAERLIEMGADVNFIDESEINEWRTPVLHDAIRAAVYNARFNTIKDLSDFQRALALVEKMLQLGADPNMFDTYGNTPIGVVVHQSRGRLTLFPEYPNVGNTVMFQDLQRIIKALISVGADIRKNSSSSDISSAEEYAQGEPILVQLLNSYSEDV